MGGSLPARNINKNIMCPLTAKCLSANEKHHVGQVAVRYTALATFFAPSALSEIERLFFHSCSRGGGGRK